MAFYFVGKDQFLIDEEAADKALQVRHVGALTAYLNFLTEYPDDGFQADQLEPDSKAWGKQHNEVVKAAGGKKFKINQIFFPIRIALCGVGGGPGIFEVMEILGKETTKQRLQSAIEHCKSNG